MKLLSPATLGLAAAFLVLNAAGTVKMYGQPSPPTIGSTATASEPLPNNISATSPLGQVVHLVQAGIDESIVQSYVTNSPSTFNLDSDRIIYLTDLGVPTSLMTLMMQRDRTIQQQIASSQTPPPAPPAPVAPATPDASTATYASEPPPDNTDVPDQSVPLDATVDYFNNNLAPYGTWVDVEGYGRCWRPTVVVYNHDWQPYGDHGHWINTDCGWYWQSGYAWNSTFHYGRWFRNPNYGWCWWPDTVWAPSWVTWRYTDDYCGWAPLPPFTVYNPGAGFLYRGSGISVSFDFGLDADSFIFVASDHFYDPHPGRYRCPRARIDDIYGRSTVLNNLNLHDENGHHMVFNGGIPPQHFTQNGGGLIRPVSIHNLPNPYTGRKTAGSPGQYNQSPGRNLSANNNLNTPAHYGNQPNHAALAGQYSENDGVRTPVASENFQPNAYGYGNQSQAHTAYPTTRPVQGAPSAAPVVRNSPNNYYDQNTPVPSPVNRPVPVQSGNRFPEPVRSEPVRSEPVRFVEPHVSPAPVPAPAAQRFVPTPAPQPVQSSGGNRSNNNNDQHGH
jgi:hypothetical protein